MRGEVLREVVGADCQCRKIRGRVGVAVVEFKDLRDSAELAYPERAHGSAASGGGEDFVVRLQKVERITSAAAAAHGHGKPLSDIVRLRKRRMTQRQRRDRLGDMHREHDGMRSHAVIVAVKGVKPRRHHGGGGGQVDGGEIAAFNKSHKSVHDIARGDEVNIARANV